MALSANNAGRPSAIRDSLGNMTRYAYDSEQFLFNQSRIKRYYYHRDHQNSILALSDENAQIVEYYEYDIYGTITKSEKIAKTLNPYRYTAREYDTDDLYYYRARYYDPTIGRFITPDPIGFLSGDTNFYRYVGNDPVNFIDPSGLIANMAGALAQLAAINRGHSDGNPFNGVVPDASVPKPDVPNSIIPQGKTVTQASKPKAAQATSKTAQTNKGDGVKIKGDVPAPAKKKEDECKQKAPWMAVAEREYNQWKNHHEDEKAVKKQHNKSKYSEGVIEDNYHKLAGLSKTTTLGNISWCASFVSYCLRDSGYKIKASTGSQYLINKTQYVKIDKPIYGAIAVLQDKGDSTHGHIGFIYGKTKKGDHALLGGNQGDTITLNGIIESYIGWNKQGSKKLIGYYVPKEYEECAKKILANGDDLEVEGNIKAFKIEVGDKTGKSSTT